MHNHPYHVSVLAAPGVLPEIVHQTGAMFVDDLRFVDEYAGEIDSPELGADLAGADRRRQRPCCSPTTACIVTGETIGEALYRAAMHRPHVPAWPTT